MKLILPIVGVVLMSLLTDVLLPSGQVNKFIKGVFSLLLILVIISPISSFLNKEVEFDFFQQGGELTVDDSFLSDTVQRRKEERESYIYRLLESEGYKVTEVEIEYEDNRISSITINLQEEDLTVKDYVCSYIGIDRECINIEYE